MSSEHHVRAKRRLLALYAAGGLLPALVGAVVLGIVLDAVAGAVAGAVVLVVVAVGLARGSVPIALRFIGGRAVPEAEMPALANLVGGLCATFGVRPPHLWLVDEPVANACTVAGTSGRAVLVVTSGLLARLGLIELEGVVAHELAHVKRHDASVSAVAVAVVGPVARLTGSDRWLRLAVGRGREYAADRLAVLQVRYPPGLHDALTAIERNPVPGPGSVFTGGRWAATRWVWIDPMVGEDEGTQPEGLLDATAVRRAALAEW